MNAIHPALGAMILLSLGGCASEVPRTITITEIQEVEIPVPVKRDPPAALLTPNVMPLPAFVPITDPLASSALTPEGENKLKALLLMYQGRIKAWQAWGNAE